MEKKLYLSRESKVIGGVCGGIGKYFQIDPVIVRLVFLILFFVFGVGLITYIIAWIIIPERPLDQSEVEFEIDEEAIKKQKEKRMKILGYILFGLGVFFILELWFNIDFELGAEFWSIGLILIGLVLIFKQKSNKK
ncbi:MAG TPA: PspC domain-containing protein [Halanaerobiales bacterium]|nr:PspC domain-containing protein [Halanaerobiales bacterium]